MKLLNLIKHVRERIGKATKAFCLLKRSTLSLFDHTAKGNLYRAIIISLLLLASECWELPKTSYSVIQNFKKKMFRLIDGSVRYKDALLESNLRTPLFEKVLIFLCLFSNVVEGKYNVNFSKQVKISNTNRRRRFSTRSKL